MKQPKEKKDDKQEDNSELPCVSFSMVRNDPAVDYIQESFNFYASGKTSKEALNNIMALMDLSLSYTHYKNKGTIIKKPKKAKEYMG